MTNWQMFWERFQAATVEIPSFVHAGIQGAPPAKFLPAGQRYDILKRGEYFGSHVSFVKISYRFFTLGKNIYISKNKNLELEYRY